MSAGTPTRPIDHRQAALRPTLAVAMFALLLLAYAVNAMDRMVFPVLLPEVRQEHGFGLQAAGLQATVFALGMGLAGLPAGQLQRRYSRRSLIVFGTLVFSVATAMTTLSFGFVDMLVWRVLSGVGEALQLAAILTVASAAFPARRGVAIGAVNVAFASGALIGPALGSVLLKEYDTWRAPMIAFGIIGVVLGLAVLCVVSPRLTEATAADGPHPQTGGAASILSRTPLTLAAVTALFGLVDFAFIGLYASYLRENLSFSPGTAGFVVGLSGLAAFASPLGGYIVDRVSARVLLPLLNLAVAACGCALFLGPDTRVWQGGFSFLFGLFASSGMYVAAAGYLIKSVSSDLASRAAGLFVTCIYVAAGFAGLLFSALVDATGWTTAGLVQIVALSILGAALATTITPHDFSRPVTAQER
ncbi:MFS transporter [Embleya sp. NBC_00896]|uniref:MFS transporter n=1 Tax=Embleya sp. NBC_00896 TaxID=2975961 RepID=UPI00386F1BC1|nr:MFS transporter [Embleya sp. NBC_00896]